MTREAAAPKRDCNRMSKIIAFTFLGCLLQGMTFSQLTSFFNLYALEEKDLSSTQYGIIMGAYAFAMMVATPICAKVLSTEKFSDKRIFFTGLFVDSCFCLIMSSVYLVHKGILFFIACLFLRLCEACGCAIGFFMAFVIIGVELPEYNHILIPLLETADGVAIVIGPAVSGILYDIGGFPIPFLVFGGTLLTLVIFGSIFFPRSLQRSDDEIDGKSLNYSSAWRFPIIVNVLCSLNTFMVVTFNEATLALRLYEKYGMAPGKAGAVFLFVGGCYAISSLTSGFLSKKVSEPRYFTLVGQFALIVALVVQAPLINFTQSLTHVFVAQALLGLGAGPAYVCSYLQSLRYLSNGNETKETYAVLSVLFTPLTALGATLGPLVAGILLDFISYEHAVLVFASLTTVSFAALVLTICMTNHGRNRHGYRGIEGSNSAETEELARLEQQQQQIC